MTRTEKHFSESVHRRVRTRRSAALVAIMAAAFFGMGNTDCGGSSSLSGTGGGASTSGGASGVAGGGSNSTGTNGWASGSGSGGQTSGGQTSGGQTSGGSAASNAECSRDAECGSGMSCTAGQCVEDGAFRITATWDARTDLDLHVRTPLGEELFYRNRNGSQGGEFLRDGCIADSCGGDEAKLESVVWDRLPAGNTSTGNRTYEFWVVNYDGTAPAQVRFEVKAGNNVETFDGSVSGSRGARSNTFAVSLGGSQQSYQFEFESPRDGGEYTPHMWLKINTNNPSVERVVYYAEQFELGSSRNDNQFPVEYTFNRMGDRTIRALGYDSSGMQIEEETIQIRVTDPNAAPIGGTGGSCTAGAASNHAQCVLNHDSAGNLSLYRSLPSGVNDNASPYENIQQAASGSSAYTSCYGTAPCSRVRLSPEMLYGMVALVQDYGYDYRVTSIAGGSHSSNSYHYAGTAIDVDIINGGSVAGNPSRARSFMQACRALGAVEVLGPGNAGHSSHVHCAWP